MPAGSGARWSPSRYNFSFIAEDNISVALFNTLSGALINLCGSSAKDLGALLENYNVSFDPSSVPESVLKDLITGNFIVLEDFDELSVTKQRYSSARSNTPIVVTITTTMDCNLGCYYCYETRTGERLKLNQTSKILDDIEKRFLSSGKQKLHLDWYGGEPLLNIEFLEKLSKEVQSWCNENNIHYTASIISNGTLWPSNPTEFVQKHSIKQVQISFDGMKAHHEKRRRYIIRETHSSFDRAVSVVDALVGNIRVDLRFNLDRGNMNDFLPFINFASDRGWFDGDNPAILQPARLASYSERSKFMRKHELSLKEFDYLREQAREKLKFGPAPEESEVPDGFPYPKTSVCAALAFDSVVIGAKGEKYRCGLQAGELERSTGHISAPNSKEQTIQSSWWQDFDPTKNTTCSKCSFLPVCWGGCPKKHLEGDSHSIKEQGKYWRENLARLVSSRTPVKLKPISIVEEKQFR